MQDGNRERKEGILLTITEIFQTKMDFVGIEPTASRNVVNAKRARYHCAKSPDSGEDPSTFRFLEAECSGFHDPTKAKANNGFPKF